MAAAFFAAAAWFPAWADSVAMPVPASPAPVSPKAAAPVRVPDREILAELEKRMFPAPACAPSCAQIQQASIGSGGGELLKVTLELHAGADSAVPIPMASGAVLADISSAQAVRLARENGSVKLLAQKGIAKVAFLYRPVGQKVTLSFEEPAQLVTQEAGLDKWKLSAGSEGSVRTLTLEKASQGVEKKAEGESGQAFSAPLYYRAQRVVEIETDGVRISTVLQRLSGSAQPDSAKYGLIEGERVISDGAKQEGRMALVEWKQGAGEVAFESKLDSKSFSLAAAKDPAVEEVWTVRSNPRLMPKLSGVAAYETSGYGQSVFKPFAGERLDVAVSEPKPVEGNRLVWEKAELRTSYQDLRRTHELSLVGRGSVAGQTELAVPPEWNLVSASLNGTKIPLAGKDGVYRLQLPPGMSSVDLAFAEIGELPLVYSAPAVKLKEPSANLVWKLSVKGRWHLWTSGETVSPSVLIWGLLAVASAAIIFLSKKLLAPAYGIGALSAVGLGAPLFLQGMWLAVAAFAGPAFLALDEKWLPEKKGVARKIGALLCLVGAVAFIAGFYGALMHLPDAHIHQLENEGRALVWYRDIGIEAGFLEARYVSVSETFYKVAMLVWALWSCSLMWRKLPAIWKRWSELSEAEAAKPAEEAAPAASAVSAGAVAGEETAASGGAALADKGERGKED